MCQHIICVLSFLPEQFYVTLYKWSTRKNKAVNTIGIDLLLCLAFCPSMHTIPLCLYVHVATFVLYRMRLSLESRWIILAILGVRSFHTMARTICFMWSAPQQIMWIDNAGKKTHNHKGQVINSWEVPKCRNVYLRNEKKTYN